MTRELLSFDDDLAALRLRSLPGIAFSRYLDADRSVFFLSESCLALTGFAAAELVALSKDGLAFNDLIDPEDWADFLGKVAVAIQMHQSPMRWSTALRRGLGRCDGFWNRGMWRRMVL